MTDTLPFDGNEYRPDPSKYIAPRIYLLAPHLIGLELFAVPTQIIAECGIDCSVEENFFIHAKGRKNMKYCLKTLDDPDMGDGLYTNTGVKAFGLGTTTFNGFLNGDNVYFTGFRRQDKLYYILSQSGKLSFGSPFHNYTADLFNHGTEHFIQASMSLNVDRRFRDIEGLVYESTKDVITMCDTIEITRKLGITKDFVDAYYAMKHALGLHVTDNIDRAVMDKLNVTLHNIIRSSKTKEDSVAGMRKAFGAITAMIRDHPEMLIDYLRLAA